MYRMSFDARRERDENLWRSIKVKQKDVPRTIRNYLTFHSNDHLITIITTGNSLCKFVNIKKHFKIHLFQIIFNQIIGENKLYVLCH